MGGFTPAPLALLVIRVVLLQSLYGVCNPFCPVVYIYNFLTNFFLNLSGRKDAEFLVCTAIQSCQKLRKLEITHCPKLSDDCLAIIVESGTSLRYLNLECTSISTNWGAGQITKLKSLRYLNLFNCRLFDSSDLISLSYNCEHLESLNIEEVC